MNKYILTFLSVIFSSVLMAQEQEFSNMYENGKINVVIGVILIIFIGVVFYLFRIDRKLNQLENKGEE